MTCSQILSSIGLALGMAGVALLFKYGPPQPDLHESFGYELEDNTEQADGRTVAEHKADLPPLRQKYTRWSEVGLGLIFLGFAFQLWAVWA